MILEPPQENHPSGRPEPARQIIDEERRNVRTRKDLEARKRMKDEEKMSKEKMK